MIRLPAYSLLLQPRPSRLAAPSGRLFQCYTGTPPYGPLWANMTSSIKPEVHNVSQHARGGSSHEYWLYTFKKFGEDRTCSSGDMLAERQTDRQTDRRGHYNTSPYRNKPQHCYMGRRAVVCVTTQYLRNFE